MLKIALISGASHALQYKREHPHASDEEVLRYVTKETKNILSKVGTEE